MKSNQKGSSVIELVLILAVMAIIGSCSAVVSYSTIDNETFTVKEKENVCDGSSCKYLIYTEEGVYENSDSFLHMKFNSSDVYNQIESGVTYEARTNMFRAPFLSMYPNILQIKEVK